MKRDAARPNEEPTTMAEICEAMERISGLRPPAPDASSELWAQYDVASTFCMMLRDFDDPGQARRAAAEFVLQNPVYPLDETRPHIERGLGRELSDDEIALRALIY